MRLAIFGGTFDPIHDAHLTLAREAVRAARLDRVLFIPAAHPPHKEGATRASYEDRYRMVELACASEPAFEPSRLEESEEQSYSIRTIEKVRASLGNEAELYFLIGADAFAEIQTWRRWRDVISEVRFLVARRPGHRYDIPPGASVQDLDIPEMPVSSSAIRARLASGDPQVPVPPAVLAYIRERGLYTA